MGTSLGSGVETIVWGRASMTDSRLEKHPELLDPEFLVATSIGIRCYQRSPLQQLSTKMWPGAHTINKVTIVITFI